MIYTFYSYKGGVGRSHALANLAAYLCYFKQRRVLMIDWDLEAPGLHFYFGKSSAEITSKGLIDVLNEHISVVRNAEADTTLSEDNFFNPFNPVSPESQLLYPLSGGLPKKISGIPLDPKKNVSSDFIQNMKEASGGGRIDLMPATRYDETFRTRLEDFDWIKFLDELYGGSYLLWLRQELNRRYDYVFIDSRTGFNDYSGICNVLMPEMNLIFVAPNAQNFEGSRAMAKRIVEAPFTQKGRRKPYILPILSRLESGHEQADKWRIDFSKTFSFVVPLLDDDLRGFSTEILEEFSAKTFLQYERGYAVGEPIIFKEGERIPAGSSKNNYQNIALYFLEAMNQNGEVDVMELVGDEIIPVYKKQLKEDPENVDALFGLGYSYYEQEDYDRAKKYYSTLLKHNPSHDAAWN
ncbi:MAG: tetratricopeptide repeat protein, partial [Bacteroidota bacterium]